ncbi:MAG: UvrD-helicase domain-containing protein, partial [Planctomycetota bacterium]
HAEAVAASWAEAEADARPERVRELLASSAVRDVREALAAATPDGPAAEKTLGVLDGLEKIERDPAATDLPEILGAVRRAAGVQGAGVKKGFGDGYEAVRDAFGNLRKAIDKAVIVLAPPEQDRGVAQEASLISLCAARLVRAIDIEFDKSLAAAGLVAVDELIGRAETLLSENASVRRRVAGGIDLLMVDEFQDTDPRQAALVRLITEADVADPPRLFVVGDHQQSIYRVRNADPTVFRDLREAAPPAGRLVLSENFRSRPEILGFVNHLFAEGMEGGYEPLTAGTASPPPEQDDLDDVGQPTFVESICGPVDGDAETRREAEAAAVTRHLARLFDDGVPRVRTQDADGRPALRPIEHGDVCLLSRTHAGFKAYERAFEAAGLPYQVVGGKAFYAQQEVLDVAMLCGWLADAGDTASLIGVLRSPMFGFDDETLLALRADRGSVAGGLFGETPPPGPLNDGQADRVLAARAILTELRDQKDTLTARALLKLAFERTGFDASLLFEFLGRRKLANQEKLLEIAADHDRTEAAPLATLSAALREAVLDEPTEPLAPVQNAETGVITFMTVHQSKGLEFPVVVVADMEWTPRAHPATVAWSRTLGPLLKLPDDVAENGRHAAWDLHAE